MKIEHLEHKHGGRITSIAAIAHETHKGRASWHFVGSVAWDDGSKSDAAEIAPFCVCRDHDDTAAKAELDALMGQLDDYLARNGKFADGEWKAAQKAGREQLQ